MPNSISAKRGHLMEFKWKINKEKTMVFIPAMPGKRGNIRRRSIFFRLRKKSRILIVDVQGQRRYVGGSLLPWEGFS